MKFLTQTRKIVSMSLATLFAWMIAGVAFAQTPISSSTPGAPSTGADGVATSNIFILVIAAVGILAGIMYLVFRPSNQQ